MTSLTPVTDVALQGAVSREQQVMAQHVDSGQAQFRSGPNPGGEAGQGHLENLLEGVPKP